MECARVIGGSNLQDAMTVRDDDQAAVLWRYALRLMGGACRAKVVVWETLLRGTSESPRNRSSPVALCCSGTTAYAAGGRSDTLTGLPPIAMPTGSESQMMQGNWLEAKSRPAARSVCLRARMPASS